MALDAHEETGDDVFDTGGDYSIVRKHPGLPARSARHIDPRSNQRTGRERTVRGGVR